MDKKDALLVFDEIKARYGHLEIEEYDSSMDVAERVFANFMDRSIMKEFRESVSSFNSLHSSLDNVLISDSSLNDAEFSDGGRSGNFTLPDSPWV